MKKLAMYDAIFFLFVIVFLASFAEIGIFAATNTLNTLQFVVGGQMVASILLLMLMAALAIFRDL